MSKDLHPGSPLSREQIARIEVGHTTVSPRAARTAVVVFLIAIAGVPVLEGIRMSVGAEAASAWTHLTRLPGRIWADLRGEADGARGAGAWPRVVAANRTALSSLAGFEDALDDESRIGRLLRPVAQRWLSGWMGAGNERVYVGRDGWLFYRPDVESVTGPAFLSSAQLDRRVAAADEWVVPPQPDPLEAIRHFKLELDRYGITLIVMPVPVKPTVHPERLSAGMTDTSGPVHNPSFASFVAALQRDGILVFDPAEALVEARRSTGRPQYLATDTHWRPEVMELVAALLADFVREHVALAPVADSGFRAEASEVRHIGDTTVMLDLPADQTIFPAETVHIRRILSPDGAPWRSSRQADVLLLGDSFANIYALGTMGWGDAAGLAEQVSYVLNRPVDRIVQNDDGAFATRVMLARTAASDPDRLARTRVIVWQFAARELAVGDWPLIDMP